MLCSNLSLDLRKIIMSIVSSAILHLRAVNTCAGAWIQTISLSGGGVICPLTRTNPLFFIFSLFLHFPPSAPLPYFTLCALPLPLYLNIFLLFVTPTWDPGYATNRSAMQYKWSSSTLNCKLVGSWCVNVAIFKWFFSYWFFNIF